MCQISYTHLGGRDSPCYNSHMYENKLETINIGRIERPDPPVRVHTDEQEMARLVSSIKEHGILVPLLVRQRGDRFEVIDGDRRLSAAWTAGLREVPVMVRNLDDRQTHIQRMLSNKDREDTDPVSEAKYIAKTIEDGIISVTEWCDAIGRSDKWIADRLEIATMPEYMQAALVGKKVSLGVCLEINQVSDELTKERYFYDAMRSGMTVHAAQISRMAVNEAIEALEVRGEQVTENAVPEIQTVPRARCAYTGELLLITEMRMVRVGIRSHENWQRDLVKQDTPTHE